MAQSLTLDDLGRWGSGGTPSSSRSDYYDGSIPWVVIEDLNDGLVDKTIKKISKAGLENSSAKLVPAGTLLMAMYGSIGKLGITAMECATNQAIAFCRCDRQKVDTHYLFFYLLHNRDRFLQAGRGGTQQNINQDYLKNYKIDLPTLGDQQRIVKLLLQADRLCRTRRYALELGDNFLPAAFLQLFGDPKLNPKQWPSALLSDLCVKFSDGPFGSNLKSEHYKSSGVRVIRLQNIGIGDFIDDDQAFIAQSHFDELRKHECVAGDILIGTLGDPNLRACIQPPNVQVALNKADCIQARPDPDKVDRKWLCWLLNMPSVLHLTPGLVHGQTRARISMGQLANVPVPVPPLDLQQKFASIVESHERLRATQREALRQAEHLFQTLLHRAFTSGL